jgi:uncharacterized protein (TIGR03435 family)
MRKIAAAIFVLAAGVATANAQQAKAPLSFEVASIKLAEPLDPQKLISGQQRLGMKVDAARVDIESVSLTDLVNMAFKIPPSRTSGPAWSGPDNPLTAQRFSVHATIPSGATKDDVPEMLQSLLAERFKLAYHREQKEQSVFALIVGKNGPKLQPSPPDAPPAPDAAPAGGSNRPDPLQVSGNPQSGMVIRGAAGALKMNMSPDGMMHLEAERLTMAQLAGSLTGFVGRQVVDETGLTGNFKLVLDLSRDDMLASARAAGINIPGGGIPGASAAGPADPGGSSIFQSVENMGLKLESRKSPVEFLIVDRLEKLPTED